MTSFTALAPWMVVGVLTVVGVAVGVAVLRRFTPGILAAVSERDERSETGHDDGVAGSGATAATASAEAGPGDGPSDAGLRASGSGGTETTDGNGGTGMIDGADGDGETDEDGETSETDRPARSDAEPSNRDGRPASSTARTTVLAVDETDDEPPHPDQARRTAGDHAESDGPLADPGTVDDSWGDRSGGKVYDLGRVALIVGALCLISLVMFEAGPAGLLTVAGIALSGIGVVLVFAGRFASDVHSVEPPTSETSDVSSGIDGPESPVGPATVSDVAESNNGETSVGASVDASDARGAVGRAVRAATAVDAAVTEARSTGAVAGRTGPTAGTPTTGTVAPDTTESIRQAVRVAGAVQSAMVATGSVEDTSDDATDAPDTAEVASMAASVHEAANVAASVRRTVDATTATAGSAGGPGSTGETTGSGTTADADMVGVTEPVAGAEAVERTDTEPVVDTGEATTEPDVVASIRAAVHVAESVAAAARRAEPIREARTAVGSVDTAVRVAASVDAAARAAESVQEAASVAEAVDEATRAAVSVDTAARTAASIGTAVRIAESVERTVKATDGVSATGTASPGKPVERTMSLPQSTVAPARRRLQADDVEGAVYSAYRSVRDALDDHEGVAVHGSQTHRAFYDACREAFGDGDDVDALGRLVAVYERKRYADRVDVEPDEVDALLDRLVGSAHAGRDDDELPGTE